MTHDQRQAIKRIAQTLKHRPRQHPSETFRESFESYTDEEIAATVQTLRDIWAKDDGRRAWEVIAAERRCLARVVGLNKKGII